MDPMLLGPISTYNENYQEFELLGQGGFGKVYRVEKNSSTDTFAAKHTKIVKSRNKEAAMTEIKILGSLQNGFILRFIEAFGDNKSIILVTEYLNGGELFEKCVDDDVLLTEQDCSDYMRQVCNGVQYLHSLSIVHLDLKPENIVLTEKGGTQIKIIDFGAARQILPGEKVRVMAGTTEFIAPEIVNYDDISTETDQWSLGVICFILLSGYSPFMDEDDNNQETLCNISMVNYSFDYEEFDNISEDAKDFISKLLKKNSQQRMSSSSCLQHSWLQVAPKTNVINCTALKKFLARRRIKAMGNVFKAMNMMRRLSKSSLSQEEADR